MARINLAFTRRMALLGYRVDAQEALAAGLLDDVHARDRVDDETLALAHTLGMRQGKALARVRRDLGTMVGAKQLLVEEYRRRSERAPRQDG